MKNTRIVITAQGGPEVLKVIEEAVPEPQPEEVRLKVLVTGVAFADVLMRYGMYPSTPPLPFSPGYDVVGTIDKLGDNVREFAIGDIVTALTMFGGYSRYLCVPARELTRVPAGVDPVEAVSLVLNYVTAQQMIYRIAQLKPGQSLLIHGAAGGVGTAALELGKLAGLKMFGTASPSKHDLVTALGGIPIDYRSDDFVTRVLQMTGGKGVDAVFDAVGGSNWWRSYKTLRAGGKETGGQLIGFGMSSVIQQGRPSKLRGLASFALMGLLGILPDGKTARWYSITTEKKRHPEWFHEDLTQLLQLLSEKKIHPAVSERLPLREARRAHELIEHAQVTGKIVLLCQE
ncbi:MAG TPA: medium chain dehydrogenase/reductase family protein [Terriglobales bacterium]|nr:medium chain dehydrogenase/reductase family protein [Terriglobales bacterium]